MRVDRTPFVRELQDLFESDGRPFWVRRPFYERKHGNAPRTLVQRTRYALLPYFESWDAYVFGQQLGETGTRENVMRIYDSVCRKAQTGLERRDAYRAALLLGGIWAGAIHRNQGIFEIVAWSDVAELLKSLIEMRGELEENLKKRGEYMEREMKSEQKRLMDRAMDGFVPRSG